ncbi:hypothetical protein CAter282_2242 [Collimonas arenae]|uniref:Uncharacterized protein n=1 Tax=Collimonas arenae TaxID=279058 RepID=A0A127QK91_9BURK|nr:hypothetical protein CAter282_2242 [Collimonas arenae]
MPVGTSKPALILDWYKAWGIGEFDHFSDRGKQDTFAFN